MGQFVLLVLGAVIVGVVIFGGAVFTMGGDRGLTPPRPDGVPFDLPEERLLTGQDVRALRFDTAVRGYRMSQVDAVLERFAEDLELAYARIAELERADLVADPAPSDSASPEHGHAERFWAPPDRADDELDRAESEELAQNDGADGPEASADPLRAVGGSGHG